MYKIIDLTDSTRNTSSPACNSESITRLTDGESDTGLLTLDYMCAGLHQISLPIGSYKYRYKDTEDKCATEVKVIGKQITAHTLMHTIRPCL